MKKLLIFLLLFLFVLTLSFGQNNSLWTTANVGWLRQNHRNTPIISTTDARAQILRYCSMYRFYTFQANDFVNPGDEGQIYIYAQEISGFLFVFFVNRNKSESIMFSNTNFGYSQVMNRNTIERLIATWFN